VAFAFYLDGLNQARVIIPGASLIDPLRDRPQALKIIWRGQQEFCTDLPGQLGAVMGGRELQKAPDLASWARSRAGSRGLGRKPSCNELSKI
jgi:hypothetical protein